MIRTLIANHKSRAQVSGRKPQQDKGPVIVPQTRPFSQLSAVEHDRLERIGAEIGFGRDATIFSQGDSAHYVYIVRGGRVKLCVTSHEGKTIILMIAGAGQILGLSSILAKKEYDVSAKAFEPCCVTAIPATDFLDFLKQYPNAAIEATASLLREYKATLSELRRLALPATAAGRLASLLLHFQDGSQFGEPIPSFTMELTHEEIAGMAGISRETASRILQQFQRGRVIRIEGRSYTVLRAGVLERLAEGIGRTTRQGARQTNLDRRRYAQ